MSENKTFTFQIGDNVSNRLGHFLWEGMKPFPALGRLVPLAEIIIYGLKVYGQLLACT